MLWGALALAIAAPALASTSLLRSGYVNWFYFCSAGQPMNIAIRHADGTMTRFSLGPGQRMRNWVQRGDVGTWRCGAPVSPDAGFVSIVTMP